jgi:hypothetical protein
MTTTDLTQLRLLRQQIAKPAFTTPAEVVHGLGAMQAQDYLGALWAVGLRTKGATEQSVEEALAAKAIVRTWPMRGTIHFVSPADVRWLLELLTPRVVQSFQSRLRELGIDSQTVARSADVLTKALEGGRQLTRPEIYATLAEAGISASGQRGNHILGQLSQSRLLCFGARSGKQPTFTLLEEWAPGAKSLPRDEALATLALRYFTGHGPATVQDLVWWSGLTVTDAKAALAMVAAQLDCEELGGQSYYFARQSGGPSSHSGEVYLLPPFDEYLIGYRDRSAALDPIYNQLVVPGGNGIFNPIIVIDGQVAGTWKRVFKRDTVVITFSPFAPWGDEHAPALIAAAEEYARFVGKRAIVSGQ